MKKIIAIFMLVLLLALAGCKGKEVEKQDATATGTGAAPSAARSDDTSPAKVGNVPLEKMGSLSSITCGDGVCNNREYLSSTKMLECRSLLDSCAIDVDGQKIGTENYYICRKDCSAQCSLDVDIDVCLKSEGVYEITTNDNKGNLYNYLLLYRGKFPFLKYGQKGKWTLDLSSIASVIGEMQSISITPGMMNSDGTVTDCPNDEKVFTSVESC
ncbi:hypothetical protein COV19_02050 [Candidatus Woesearchaeota archaeon CG10_big_fil_rev_8_21_14_0_10_44_13]|nr:MAG: hypothetical protein COV19_02050 [Candidatus Woesearchaeota archaeon CG10_big_fil_rev_8_21_14_0_10_44_13]